jgi:hypothetical protein
MAARSGATSWFGEFHYGFGFDVSQQQSIHCVRVKPNRVLTLYPFASLVISNDGLCFRAQVTEVL